MQSSKVSSPRLQVLYFIDIVEIGLKMYELVASIRFDGRTLLEKRGTLLQDFKDADGDKVLRHHIKTDSLRPHVLCRVPSNVVRARGST
jgi:hypothetical protein